MQTIEETEVDVLIEALENDNFEPDPQLTPEIAEILEYFRVAESLTSISYAPLVRSLPAYLYKSLRKFVDTWEIEEEKHGRVLQLYLEKHGYSKLRKPSETLTLRYKLKVLRMIILSWPLWFVSTGVYLIVGSLNEATTSAGYWALMNQAKAYPFLVKIIRAIQEEETSHLNSYSDDAEKFLVEPWKKRLAEYFLPIVYSPIGSDHGDMANLVRLLLKDGRGEGFYSRLRSNLAKANRTLPNIGNLVLHPIQRIDLVA